MGYGFTDRTHSTRRQRFYDKEHLLILLRVAEDTMLPLTGDNHLFEFGKYVRQRLSRFVFLIP